MLKKRTLSLLLSLAMLLAFMPAMAFAEDAADNDPDQPAVTDTVEAEEAAVEEPDVEVPEVEEAAEPTKAPEEVTYEEEEEDPEEEPEIVSLVYNGPTLYYEPWDDPSYVYPYIDDVTFTLNYSDGTSENIVLKDFECSGEDDHDFFFEDEDPIFDEEGEYPINVAWLDFDYDNATVEKGLPVSFNGFQTFIPVAEIVYPKPVSAEFIAPEGFVAESAIGKNFVENYELWGEGNKFVITWDNGDVEEYSYAESEDYWGFYLNGDTYENDFWSDVKLDKRIAAGTSTVTGTVTVETEYGTEELPVTVNVFAEKYYAYVEYKSYSYTGKKITPKVVVKYFDGKKIKTMSKKWYTCKPAKQKDIGWYGFDVNIKAKYQAKYGEYLWGNWQIDPKTPTIKKATAKNGAITVTWGKFSKAVLKVTDGFIVEISKDKNFNTTYEEIEVGDGATKAVFSGLDKGTYYARVFSVGIPSGYGDGSYWLSKASKVKKVVVK